MFRPLKIRFLLMAALVAVPAVMLAEDSGAPLKPPPVPSVTLPLIDYGYKPNGNGIAMRAGHANATVNFIDPENILLSFSTRRLMPRLQDQRETDDDHTVRAVVIHLPDGKVVREAEWRMHDRAPYLWPLANGRFLLRLRSDLYSLDPLGDFNPKRFGERLLLRSDADLQNLQFSPAKDLMLMETVPAVKVGDDPEEKRSRPVSSFFYRITQDHDGLVRLQSRGRAVSKDAFFLAFTSIGELQTVKEDRTHWGFDFHTYNGKKIELAGFTSTCRPRSIFVSDAEFFAYGCRGGDDRKLLGGFNLLAEAKWVVTLDDVPMFLAVDNAPAVGRFAVRNTIFGVAAPQPDGPSGADEVRMQEVRVYGSREGEELLRVTVSPMQKPGGNFALSPDGLKAVVLRGDNLEIYALPPIPAADTKLHEKEQAALAPLQPAEDANVAAALSTDTSSKTDTPAADQ